jgi:hypothetical protein
MNENLTESLKFRPFRLFKQTSHMVLTHPIAHVTNGSKVITTSSCMSKYHKGTILTGFVNIKSSSK